MTSLRLPFWKPTQTSTEPLLLTAFESHPLGPTLPGKQGCASATNPSGKTIGPPLAVAEPLGSGAWLGTVLGATLGAVLTATLGAGVGVASPARRRHPRCSRGPRRRGAPGRRARGSRRSRACWLQSARAARPTPGIGLRSSSPHPAARPLARTAGRRRPARRSAVPAPPRNREPTRSSSARARAERRPPSRRARG